MSICNEHHKVYQDFCRTCCDECTHMTLLGCKNQPTGKALNSRYHALRGSMGTALDQGQFGVCGLASAVYLLFRHNLTGKARVLFEATFTDHCEGLKIDNFRVRDSFHKIPMTKLFGPKVPKQNLAANMVDTTMSRALAYLLQKTDSVRYNTEKSATWNHTNVPSFQGNDEHWAKGNVPLRTNTLAYVVNYILGFSVTSIAYNADAQYATDPERKKWMGPDLPRNVRYEPFTSVDEFFEIYRERRVNVRNSFAIAGIKALTLVMSPDFGDADYGLVGTYSETKKDIGGVETTSMKRKTTITDTTRTSGDPYDHWVVIEAASRVGDDVVMNLWTWKSKWHMTLKADAFLHTVHDVIFGVPR